MNRFHDPLETLAHVREGDVAAYFTARQRVRRMPSAGERTSSPDYWAGQRVVVTGCSDFLGALVVEHLNALGCREILVPPEEHYDLTRQAGVERLFREARPTVVLHLAEQVGGIGANQRSPGEFFYENLMMGALMIEEARKSGVAKFVQTGSVTSYPRSAPVPFREGDFWNGYPDESNAAYGIAKKALLTQLQAYRDQYGFPGVYLIPANMYGPRDSHDPERSYVIPALIRRMVEAEESGAEEVEIWGAGGASREFLYVDDCARAILLAAEHYDGRAPVNVGTGEEIRIAELAALIARITGYGGRLVFDASKPEGQPRRGLDTSRARELFGFVAHTPLEEGISETVKWYRAARERPAVATG